MSDERKLINYTIACVSEFARKYNMKLRDAFSYLFQYKAISFIKDNYDIEHTLSFNDVIEDMRLICRQNGGTI